MAEKRRPRHRFILLLAVALLAAGGSAAFVEARAYFASGVLQSERFDALAAGREVIGLSTASQRLVLDNCLDGVVAAYARTRPAEARDSVATECRNVGDRITKLSPAFSYAWYIGAVAAERLGDTAGVIERLRQSQITGPTEQWIAQLRVDIAEDNLAALPPDVRARHDRDLGLLVASRQGVASIAARYVKDTAFRDRITAIVEKMSQPDQQRFLANVEAVAARAGG